MMVDKCCADRVSEIGIILRSITEPLGIDLNVFIQRVVSFQPLELNLVGLTGTCNVLYSTAFSLASLEPSGLSLGRSVHTGVRFDSWSMNGTLLATGKCHHLHNEIRHTSNEFKSDNSGGISSRSKLLALAWAGNFPHFNAWSHVLFNSRTRYSELLRYFAVLGDLELYCCFFPVHQVIAAHTGPFFISHDECLKRLAQYCRE